MVNMESIRQLAAAILGIVSSIANMERTAGSCYTRKNHTHAWCIQRGSDRWQLILGI
jgi:hypothetical protein